MPGLWDAHVHYFGARRISIDEIYRTPPAAAGARIAEDLRATVGLRYESPRFSLTLRTPTYLLVSVTGFFESVH